MGKWKNTILAFGLVAILSACGGGSSDAEATIQDKYLAEIKAKDSSAFVSDDAALLYLKNYCQAAETAKMVASDPIDAIVTSYCNTQLATDLGVTPAPTPDASIDLEAFAKRALDEYGVGQVEADGSQMDAVAVGQSLCSGDIDMMVTNLGSDFEGSFQYFALSTFCPEKIPS